MAATITNQRLRWTPEEEAVILQVRKESGVGLQGKANAGYCEKAAALLPHRSMSSIRAYCKTMIRKGTLAERKARSTYRKPVISFSDAAWLGAMVDGEGSVGNPFDESGKFTKWTAVKVALCANKDQGVLNHVRYLVPTCKQHIANPNDKKYSPVYVLTITGQLAVRDILEILLPHIYHSVKKERAARMYAFLCDKLGRN